MNANLHFEVPEMQSRMGIENGKAKAMSKMQERILGLTSNNGGIYERNNKLSVVSAQRICFIP